jgi:outer membrane immunogenic protein
LFIMASSRLSCSRARFLCAATIALCAASSAAAAGELLNPVRAYYWQGPYVGANLGYQWGITTRNPTEPAGVAGGLQAGYNVQQGQVVFGAEADLQLSGAEDRFAPWKFSNPWFGTLRGRAGFALNNILFYGTAGLAYGNLRAQNTATGFSQDSSGLGWVIGAGMEVALMANWSVRAEYLYVDLSDRAFAVTGTSNGLESGLLRMGVNYRF